MKKVKRSSVKPIETEESYKMGACNHNIIIDYVDITPERSKVVYYCDKCFETFIFKSGKLAISSISNKQTLLSDN